MEKREAYLAPVRAPLDELATVNTWISIEEIALATGRSATTVRGLLSAGIIPGRRQGNRWYCKRSAFESWQSGGTGSETKTADLESLTAAIQAVLDGRVRVVVTFEPVRSKLS